MNSGDSLGLIPYNFEPEYSLSEIEALTNHDDSPDTERALDEWCDCENCMIMGNTDENICCRQSDITLGSMDDYECITDHTHFSEIVLNPVILEVAFIQIMSFKGVKGRAPDQLTNRYVKK